MKQCILGKWSHTAGKSQAGTVWAKGINQGEVDEGTLKPGMKHQKQFYTHTACTQPLLCGDATCVLCLWLVLMIPLIFDWLSESPNPIWLPESCWACWARGCVVRYDIRTACFSLIHPPVALQCMMGVIQLPTANILHRIKIKQASEKHVRD